VTHKGTVTNNYFHPIVYTFLYIQKIRIQQKHYDTLVLTQKMTSSILKLEINNNLGYENCQIYLKKE
jgi:hypothetical protein